MGEPISQALARLPPALASEVSVQQLNQQQEPEACLGSQPLLQAPLDLEALARTPPLALVRLSRISSTASCLFLSGATANTGGGLFGAKPTGFGQTAGGGLTTGFGTSTGLTGGLNAGVFGNAQKPGGLNFGANTGFASSTGFAGGNTLGGGLNLGTASTVNP